MKNADYKFALLVSLVVFSVWLFGVLRFANPITILKDYWNDLKLHQSLVSTALVSMLASIVSVIILVLYQPEIAKISWVEGLFTRDFVSILIFCIGVCITAFQVYRKKFDKIELLGFCSKTITIFTSFMVFGRALAITPFLFQLRFLSPFIELLVLFILFVIKSDKTGIYLKNVVGLLLLGMIISNSFLLVLGWGGSAEEIRQALSQVLQITEDAAKVSIETKQLVDSERLSFLIWDRGYELFVFNTGSDEGFVSENKEWLDTTIQDNERAIDSFERSYDDSKVVFRDFDAQIDSISIKSSGTSLDILNLIKNSSRYSQDVLDLRNKEITTLTYFNQAIITGKDDYYKSSEMRSRELLDLVNDKYYEGRDFFNAIYLSTKIRNHIEPTIKLINVNSTHATLSIEFVNNSEFQFPAAIHIVILPQCKYYPINIERDWQDYILTDTFETEFAKGTNTYHIQYKIPENHCDYPNESVFIFIDGELPDEYWPYISFSFKVDLES